MTIKAGVWIDHRKAVVVLITDQGEELRQFNSDGDTPAESANIPRGAYSHRPKTFVPEDTREHRAMNQLNHYYDQVFECMHDADAILVFGPGEAKGEFTKRIEGTKHKGHVAEVQTTDKLTDPQIASYVRQHFQ